MKRSINVFHTPTGVRFGLLGEKGPSPAPTLFIFAVDLETSLESTDFASVGHALAKQGFLLVSLDVPCHGKDREEGEPEGLTGWRARIERGGDPVSAFTARASKVLDYLIGEGYTDSQKVVACGTSRGGFIALHFAAAEPRVLCVAAFCPLTDLLALREFDGMQHHQATRAFNTVHLSNRLANRGVWVRIGLDDERVGTDNAIALTRRIVEAAAVQGLQPNVELHVAPPVGHGVPPNAHEAAAAWILAQTNECSR